MAEMDKRMDQQDMYYFGGKGDAHRQYWMRYHPTIKQMSISEINLAVNRVINNSFTKKEKKIL